jgi:hypothetical protein
MLSACKPLPGPLSKIFSMIAPLLDGRLLRDGFASLVQTFSPSRLLGMLCASGETAYMIGSTAPSSFDSRVYLVAPYNGTPRDFMRFERDLNIRLAREYVPGGQPGDADYSLQETLEGTDEYGVVFQGTPEALTDPPHSAPQRRAFKRHERRNRMLASYVISHILDENLKAMIQAAHPYDGYAAWILLKAHRYREPNDLTILEMNKIWADSDFNSVGIDENSIGNMIRLLYELNNKRPVARRYSEDEIVEKLLSCFKPTISESLSHTAMMELAAAPADRKFVRPGPPITRSVQMLLEFMEPLWRLTFQSGGIRGGRRGHTADGALRVDADEEDEDSVFAVRNDRRTRLPARPSVPSHEIAQRNLPHCFRCQGIGHVASSCGNPADIIINLTDAISILITAKERF